MSTTAASRESRSARGTREGLPVIDLDTHCGFSPEHVLANLPERWKKWIDQVGLRAGASTYKQLARHRQFGHRLDTVPQGGGLPGSDPDFAREQLLDFYDLTAAMLNPLDADVGGWEPAQLARAWATAINDQIRDYWLPSDPRWYASVSVAVEQPAAAADEIVRCLEAGGRWAHVILPTRNERPIGNQRYWPIFEAAEHFDLPVAFHVGVSRATQITGCGWPSYYYEDHVGFAGENFSIVPSMIFEGLFERFPGLKIVFLEQGWGWVPTFAWRLDASYRVMRDEVPGLQRLPSEYLREHFWFTTQPMEEPEDPRWFDAVIEHLERFGLTDRLVFSSDYFHWDFDSPEEVLPRSLSYELKRKILGANASALYGIPLPDDQGGSPA